MSEPMTLPRSPYERIGGAAALKVATDMLYQRLLADDELRHYFIGIDLPVLKRHMVILLGQVLGGPGGYDLDRLGPAHGNLYITRDHFLSTCGHVVAVLQELNLPTDIIDLVASVALSLESVIVNEQVRPAAA